MSAEGYCQFPQQPSKTEGGDYRRKPPHWGQQADTPRYHTDLTADIIGPVEFTRMKEVEIEVHKQRTLCSRCRAAQVFSGIPPHRLLSSLASIQPKGERSSGFSLPSRYLSRTNGFS